MSDNIIYNCCCTICKKEFKGGRFFNSHFTQVHVNKSKGNGKRRGSPLGRIPWNKGLTKETDERVKKSAQTQIEKIASGEIKKSFKGKKHTEETKQNISEKLSLNNRGGRSKWYTVGEQRVQGSYEKQFAEALDNQHIEWNKLKVNNKVFKYYQDGKLRSYAPDFYLPKYDIFVEIKGFWWGNDEYKMNCVKQYHQDVNLIVIFGKNKLDYICENIHDHLLQEPKWSW